MSAQVLDTSFSPRERDRGRAQRRGLAFYGELAEELDLVRRGYELRKARKIGIILADCGRLFICDSETDPWGTKRLVSLERFRELVEAAEQTAGWTVRKPPVMERSCRLALASGQ